MFDIRPNRADEKWSTGNGKELRQFFRFARIALIIICVAASPGWAKDKPSQNAPRSKAPSSAKPDATKDKAPPKSAQAAESVYSATPLDLTVEKLPPKYRGNDMRKIFSAYKARAEELAKSEFENEAEYKNRLSKLTNSDMADGLKFGDHIAYSKNFMEGDMTPFFTFEILPPMNASEKQFMEMANRSQVGRTKLSYIAEKGEMKIAFGTPLLFHTVKTSSYVGTNAYGASIDVGKAEGDVYLLKFVEFGNDELGFQEKVSGDVARNISKTGSILIIGKVVSPYIETNPVPLVIQPTVDSPRDVAIGMKVLNFKISEIWLYNYETGEIFLKKRIGSADNGVDEGDGTATDGATNLMWQKKDDGNKRNWDKAMTYCEGLELGGHSDWRLPDIEELKSIVKGKYPSINSSDFPNTKSSLYWSSTTSAYDTTGAWGVSFDLGFVHNYSKTASYGYARCVRPGQ